MLGACGVLLSGLVAQSAGSLWCGMDGLAPGGGLGQLGLYPGSDGLGGVGCVAGVAGLGGGTGSSVGHIWTSELPNCSL